MKRQGEQGFTWDSKAEEWRDWCLSVLEQDRPRDADFWDRHDMMLSDYGFEWLTEALHSPTQRDLTPQTYSPPTRRKTPSYGAIIGVCGLVLVAVAFWIWG